VLIIDDHKGSLDTYSTVLRLAGFETAAATTGHEGLTTARALAFDVIIVDLRLPDLSGIDVVRELRRDGTGARMIIVTAFPTIESSFDASAAGADGYVDGPLFGEEVIDLVRDALNGANPVRHPSRRSGSDQAGELNLPFDLVIDPRVREVIRLIDADLAKSWSVSELATRVGLSESRLRYLFDSCLGVSVAAYIRERRLQHVARRLSTTFDDVQQIANSVGFGSTSLRDFRRAFGERFGMSPTTYRAQYWQGTPLSQ
jgi:AraC-like DNA-binding protein